jgi:hypothetical protein
MTSLFKNINKIIRENIKLEITDSGINRIYDIIKIYKIQKLI